MTDKQAMDWDAAEQALVNAEAEWQLLLTQTPDDAAHHSARNQIVRTLEFLRDAQGFGCAARMRMPTQ